MTTTFWACAFLVAVVGNLFALALLRGSSRASREEDAAELAALRAEIAGDAEYALEYAEYSQLRSPNAN